MKENHLLKKKVIKPKLTLCFYPQMILGGGEQLALRLIKGINQIGEKACLLTFGCSETICKQIEKDQIELILHNKGYKGLGRRIAEINQCYDVRIITFFWGPFVRLKHECKDIKILLYVIQKDILNTTVPRLVQITRRAYGGTISKLLKNGQIIFMDEETRDTTFKFYRGSTFEHADYIVRLPIDIIPYNEERCVKRTRSASFNILTIARADFPFKGYLFGLIDCFNRLHQIHPNMHLTIISHGEGFEKLQAHLGCTSGITLVGETPHDELKKYYAKSNLYIGMGTTILEASNYDLPSIPVRSDTYQLEVSGWFSSNPESVCVYGDMPITAPYQLILQAKTMPPDKYIALSEKTKEALRNVYDTRVCVKRLLEQLDHQTTYYTNSLLIGENLLRAIQEKLFFLTKPKKQAKRVS